MHACYYRLLYFGVDFLQCTFYDITFFNALVYFAVGLLFKTVIKLNCRHLIKFYTRYKSLKVMSIPLTVIFTLYKRNGVK